MHGRMPWRWREDGVDDIAVRRKSAAVFVGCRFVAGFRAQLTLDTKELNQEWWPPLLGLIGQEVFNPRP